MSVSPADDHLRRVPADIVRAIIADAVLARGDVATQLGSIALWEHQREAVARVRSAIAEFGGALLADEVGLGKTFVAIAVAGRYASTLVVAPASLRATWERAFEATSSPQPWISFESLSRGAVAGITPDLVIVDEAHHARNPATRRYGALAALCMSADVLLMSATPIHNAKSDLRALLALFLGGHAHGLDDTALGRLIVRRTHATVRQAQTETRGGASLPAIAPAVTIPIAEQIDVAERIMGLPPTVPLEDGGSADVLVAFTLVRQWASSVGALRGALRRRIGRTRALIDTLRAGRLPSRIEIDAWLIGDDAQQLAFAELLAPVVTHHDAPPSSIAALLTAAERHQCALTSLDESLGDGADSIRASALRAVLDAHAGEKVLAFSQFADTVAAYWRFLRTVPGVCAMSAAGGRIAAGRLSRNEAIERFAPLANGGHRPQRVDDIRLLLTTDILSEGVNLQDASVVVHLDLPWTWARVEQRVGRVARAGSVHRRIAVYTMAPPASGEAIVAIERRLREKIIAAAASVGVPAAHVADVDFGLAIAPPAACERLRSIVARWQRTRDDSAVARSGVAYAVMRGEERGWLAVLRSDQGLRVVGSLGASVGDDAAIISRVALLCGQAAVECEAVSDHLEAASAVQALEAWLASERAAVLAGVRDIEAVRHRRSSMARLANVEALPRTRRASVDGLAAQARRVSSGRLSHAAELSMRDAGREPGPEAWLLRVARLARSGESRPAVTDPTRERLTALLVLVS